MGQLETQLAAADVVLDQAILDGIDEIVPGHHSQRSRQLVPQRGDDDHAIVGVHDT